MLSIVFSVLLFLLGWALNGQATEVTTKLETDVIEEVNFYKMTTLLKKHRHTFPELVNNCFKLMVRKKLHDPDLEARIRGMIR